MAKFKLKRSHMVRFNDDCNEAACRCPQYNQSWKVPDRMIYEKTISAKQLVKHWKSNEELFDYGYDAFLTEFAVSVFLQYKMRKRSWST